MKIPITEDENKICNEEGAYLFGYLRKKYANENCRDLDICLNSLCFALLRLIDRYVPQDDKELFVKKIIMPILLEGIK